MDLPIKCAECGAWLDGIINNKGEIEVDLCSDCEASIKEESRKEGYDEGYAERDSEVE